MMSLPTPELVPTAKIFNQRLITALGYAGGPANAGGAVDDQDRIWPAVS